MFMMPSRYEPCGLNQMYSLRYGTVPIVRATGGLDDTVQEWDVMAKTGNGFKFTEYSADALIQSVFRARKAFENKEEWRILQKNGMGGDYMIYSDLAKITLSTPDSFVIPVPPIKIEVPREYGPKW